MDRSWIGVVSEPRTIEVEKGQLRFFAKATGEKNPIYVDEAAARAAGYPGLPAPPTFAFSLMLAAPARRGNILGDMGVDVRRVLHGEQAFIYHHPIHAGDVITLTTETTDIFEKKGGALEFIVQETRALNAAGELCVELRSVTVVRDGGGK